MKLIITEVPKKKNRLKLTGTIRWVECDAGFLPIRGYYQLKPLAREGIDGDGAWQQFWDVWDLHKSQLKKEGLSVRKLQGEWVIYYRPQGNIKLDEKVLYAQFWK